MKLAVCVVFVLASCEVSEDDETSDALRPRLRLRLNTGHLRTTFFFFSPEDLSKETVYFEQWVSTASLRDFFFFPLVKTNNFKSNPDCRADLFEPDCDRGASRGTCDGGRGLLNVRASLASRYSPGRRFLHVLAHEGGVGHAHERVGQRDDGQQVLGGDGARDAVRALAHHLGNGELPALGPDGPRQLPQQRVLKGGQHEGHVTAARDQAEGDGRVRSEHAQSAHAHLVQHAVQAPGVQAGHEELGRVHGQVVLQQAEGFGLLLAAPRLLLLVLVFVQQVLLDVLFDGLLHLERGARGVKSACSFKNHIPVSRVNASGKNNSSN